MGGQPDRRGGQKRTLRVLEVGNQARPDFVRNKSVRIPSIFGKEVLVESLEFQSLLDPYPDTVINKKFRKPFAVDKYDALRNFCSKINGVL